MLPSQAEYQQALPYSINMRRQDECYRNIYRQYCDQHDMLKYRAEVINRVRTKPQRVSQQQILMKIKFMENRSRIKLKQLFTQEFEEYKKIVDRKPSYDERIAEMEAVAQQYINTKEAEKQRFNEEKIQQQLIRNSDELRQKQQQLNAAQCRLAWDKQEIDRQRRLELEREIQKQVDQMAIDDYKQYLQQEAENMAKVKQRAIINKQALDAQLSVREQVLAEQRAQRQLEDGEFKMLTRQREIISQLERDTERQKAALLQKELMIQIALAEKRRTERKQKEYFDYQQFRKEAEDEIMAQKQKEIEDKKNLFILQNAYCELVRFRKQKLEEETKALERAYLQYQQKEQDEKARERERLDAKRKQLADRCAEWNYQQTIPDANQKMKEQLQKKMELEKALKELQEYEEHKLALMREELAHQQALREWYEKDILLKNQVVDEQKRRDREEYLGELKRDNVPQVVKDKMKELQRNIDEIKAVPSYRGPRPMPKTYWYQ